MTVQLERRALLKSLGQGSAVAGALSVAGCAVSTVNLKSDFAWNEQAAEIRRRIIAPTFPARRIVITELGAQAGTEHNVGPQIQQAIEQLATVGGGKVVIPPGEFYTGPVHLKSNINLHLTEGAVLHFIANPELYKPYVYTRWEGMELMGFSPLIYAFEATNVAITGKGTLEGGGSPTQWWPWKGRWKDAAWGDDPVENQSFTRDALRQMGEDNIPVSERVFDNNYLRPPFIQPYRCKNVLIEGVTVKNSPFWLVNPVLCENVTVRGIYCNSYGPNSDGCDPECCTDVLIEDCVFDTGDDCIAIKSGRNADGRRVGKACENILINNCQMKAGHGGIVIGSEISGGVKNLYAQHCEMSSPDLDRGIRIKTNSIRGGHLQNLNYRYLRIGRVKDAVVVNFYYEEGDVGEYLPKLEAISIENVHVVQAQRAFMMRGYPHTPITGITLKNLTFESVEKPSVIENVADVHQSNIRVNGASYEI